MEWAYAVADQISTPYMSGNANQRIESMAETLSKSKKNQWTNKLKKTKGTSSQNVG